MGGRRRGGRELGFRLGTAAGGRPTAHGSLGCFGRFIAAEILTRRWQRCQWWQWWVGASQKWCGATSLTPPSQARSFVIINLAPFRSCHFPRPPPFRLFPHKSSPLSRISSTVQDNPPVNPPSSPSHIPAAPRLTLIAPAIHQSPARHPPHLRPPPCRKESSRRSPHTSTSHPA